MSGYGPRMHSKLLVAALALACCLAAAAGCGGDDDAGKAKTATTPPLTKAQYIDRADKICQASTAQLKAAGVKLAGGREGKLSQAQIVTFLKDSSVPTYEQMLERLRALRPPPDDAGALDAYLASLANAIDTVKADPAKYAKPTAPDPFDDSNARAERYGLKVCGS